MICKKCTIAADLMTQLNELDPADVSGQNDYKARDFTSVARTLHGFCKGGTHCDCQHGLRIPSPKEKESRKQTKLRVSIDSSLASDSPAILGDFSELKIEPLY